MGYVTPLDAAGHPEDPYTATEFNIDDFSLHGTYNNGICAMPVLCILPGCDGWDMVAVWSCMDENNQDEGGTNFYFKLFAAYSGDGGMTWTDPVHITNDFMFTYNEYVYNQAVVLGQTLIVASQVDGMTGTFVQSDDTDAFDNYYQGLTFDLNELFPNANVGVQEVEHNNHITVYPNPAVGSVNVTLNKSAEVTVYNIMGQAVMTVEGRAGVNTLDISSLTSGIYFVNAGNDTQKFIVK